jgi:hypothetical protein
VRERIEAHAREAIAPAIDGKCPLLAQSGRMTAEHGKLRAEIVELSVKR